MTAGPWRDDHDFVTDSSASGAALETVDVLVVGAGPTGLALAVQLASFGVSVRVVDGKAHPVAESRALALQPRTLEVLRGSVTDRLLERGNPAVRLCWHVGDRTATLPLFDMGMADTAYPFLLFLSQAETEQALVDHLRDRDVAVQWNTRLVRFARGAPEEGSASGRLSCELVDAEGRRQTVLARYLVGCDGAHSTVREQAGISFTGGRYPQTFLLADTDAEGLAPEAAHVWFGPDGPLFFFPLVRPAAWRMLTPRPERGPDEHPGRPRPSAAGPVDAGPVDPEELQAVVDAATGGGVRLAQPEWSTAFLIHHRQAATYMAGPVFLAGDAAHIHSPAGAQGMNTGIQDAVNLGWKLALVCLGRAPERLLDSYDRERRPVGAFVLRFTDRAFTAATATSAAARLIRAHLAPRALALAGHLPRARALAFRTVSQLAISYPDILGGASDLPSGPPRDRDRAGSSAVRRLSARVGRTATAARARRPAPGDRLPDAKVTVGGRTRWLLDSFTAPAFHLLLCGPVDAWSSRDVDQLTRRHGDLLQVHRLTPPAHAGADPGMGRVAGDDETEVLVDHLGEALRRLRVRGTGSFLVRPDGHVAARNDDADLSAVQRLLATWLTGEPPRS